MTAPTWLDGDDDDLVVDDCDAADYSPAQWAGIVVVALVLLALIAGAAGALPLP